MELSTLIAQNLEDTPSKLVDLQLFLDNINSGSGLGGTNYVFVRGNGTPDENWTELITTYDLAKTMPRYLGLLTNETSGHFYPGQTFTLQPSGTYYHKVTEEFEGVISSSTAYYTQITEAEALSVQTTVIIGAGRYHHSGNSYYFNAPSINLISLSNQPDVIFSSSSVWGDVPIAFGGNHSTYIGLNTEGNAFYTGAESSYETSVYINCKGGNYSFAESEGYDGLSKGTFINCIAKDYSFGYETAASGTFKYCTGGESSFGGVGTASGTFQYCTGGESSFGGVGTASGTFTNCKGGHNSFAGGGIASGTFTNCEGSDNSFGGPFTSGIFINCVGGVGAFGSGPGTFINCKGPSLNFGSGGEASGTYKDCIGGDGSFGGNGIASGTFNNCIGDDGSFGGGISIAPTARLYYCKLITGTFETPEAGGKLILCIDGNDAIVTTA